MGERLDALNLHPDRLVIYDLTEVRQQAFLMNSEKSFAMLCVMTKYCYYECRKFSTILHEEGKPVSKFMQDEPKYSSGYFYSSFQGYMSQSS